MDVFANGRNSSDCCGGCLGEEEEEKLERRPLAAGLALVVEYRCGLAAGVAVVIGYAAAVAARFKCGGEVGLLVVFVYDTLDEMDPALTRAVAGLVVGIEGVGSGAGGASLRFFAMAVTFERILIGCDAQTPVSPLLSTTSEGTPISDCATRGPPVRIRVLGEGERERG